MTRGARLGALLLLGAGIAAVFLGRSPETAGAGRAGSLSSRLLGPVSKLAGGWQWVRVRQALDDRRPELAYDRARLALELDPAATSAWAFFAGHLANDRASPFREPDPARRQRWTEAALALLRRGEAQAERPAELAAQAAAVLVRVAEYDGAIPWPGGRRGALLGAQEHLERATDLDPDWTEGWVLLAALRGLWLASPELVEGPEERVAALRRGLATLEEAASHGTRPGPIAFQRGMLLTVFAEEGEEAELGLWPGGRAGALGEALRAFEAAREAGFPAAAAAVHELEEALH